MADLGLSFMPSAQGTNPQSQPNVEPTQEAIKILSLHLPKVLGGGAFAPAPLLNAAGSQGNPFAQNALGQTQHVTANPLAAALGSLPPSTPGPVGPTVTGAPTAPSLGSSLPPGLLAAVMQILSGQNGGNGGGAPTQTRVLPGDQNTPEKFSPLPGPPQPPDLQVTLTDPPPNPAFGRSPVRMPVGDKGVA